MNINGEFKMKDKVLQAISIRLEQLNQSQLIINKSPDNFPTVKIDNEARIDELESLLNYIKKMVD